MCEWCTSRFWHHTKEKASNCMNGAYLKYIGHYSDTFTLGCVFTILPPRQWRGFCDGREAIKFCVSCSNGFCPLQKPISSGKTNTGTDRAKKKVDVGLRHLHFDPTKQYAHVNTTAFSRIMSRELKLKTPFIKTVELLPMKNWVPDQ